MYGHDDKAQKPASELPRWGSLRCGFRPTRQSRLCRRCGARMAYSTNDALKKIEAAYLSSASWWERY